MLDYMVIATAWIVTVVALIIFVPKDKIREAQVIYLFKQLITWLFGLAVVELRLIEYPVRLLSYANRTSFTFEYFIYPSLCVIFNLRYPQNDSYFRQFLYYSYYCTAMTLLEVFVERYTNVITYLHWSWYVTWITLFITFYISRSYYVWFFKIKRSKLDKIHSGGYT